MAEGKMVQSIKTFKQYFNEQEEVKWHYTLVSASGRHSERHIIVKPYGHVPDEKVQSLVNYILKVVDDQGGEVAEGEYDDFRDIPEMSDMYKDVDIEKAVGEYLISLDELTLVKHFPTKKQLKPGNTNLDPSAKSAMFALQGQDVTWGDIAKQRAYNFNKDRI